MCIIVNKSISGDDNIRRFKDVHAELYLVINSSALLTNYLCTYSDVPIIDILSLASLVSKV